MSGTDFGNWQIEKAVKALVDEAQAVADRLGGGKPHAVEQHAAAAQFWAAVYLPEGVDLTTLASWKPAEVARFIRAAQRSMRAGGAQGELPFVPGDGWEAKVADFRSLDAFLTLDFSDGPQPELYIGKAFDLSAMQASTLRSNEQVEETAGRFRGQIKALDCPNCGAPISFVAAMATQVVCPSCAASRWTGLSDSRRYRMSFSSK